MFGVSDESNFSVTAVEQFSGKFSSDFSLTCFDTMSASLFRSSPASLSSRCWSDGSVLLDNHSQTFKAELSRFLGNNFLDFLVFDDLVLTFGERTIVEFLGRSFGEQIDDLLRVFAESIPGSDAISDSSGNFAKSSLFEKNERTSTKTGSLSTELLFDKSEDSSLVSVAQLCVKFSRKNASRLRSVAEERFKFVIVLECEFPANGNAVVLSAKFEMEFSSDSLSFSFCRLNFFR